MPGNGTKRIRLIVTGDLETQALTASLRAVFGDRIEVAGRSHEVEWLRPQRVSGGATSNRLRRGGSIDRALLALARRMVAEAWRGADGVPPDLILVLDDVELHNFDQPDVICACFGRAVEAEIAALALNAGAEERLRARIRERCSLHLLMPMIEAYLFGDAAALVRAGCAPDVHPKLARADVEDFESADPAWLDQCAVVNAQKSAPPLCHPWWREERHAKHYLEFLVDQRGGFYQETVGGAAALRTLDWRGVPAAPSATPFLRALFQDLAEFFAVTSPLGPGEPSPLTCPARAARRNTLLLRNM